MNKLECKEKIIKNGIKMKKEVKRMKMKLKDGSEMQ